MDSDRWKQVDSLLQAVLERPPEERDEFLRDASACNDALEREVRSRQRFGKMPIRTLLSCSKPKPNAPSCGSGGILAGGGQPWALDALMLEA
jgi:hypothetical protein